MKGLNVYQFKDDIAWEMFVCYNRDRINFRVYPQLARLVLQFNNILDSSDIIIGTIADDRMSMVLEDFFNGARTDIGLLECLQYVKLGKQVVLKTQKACDRVRIVSQQQLTPQERQYAIERYQSQMRGVMNYVNKSQHIDNTTMRGHRFAWLLENWGNW